MPVHPSNRLAIHPGWGIECNASRHGTPPAESFSRKMSHTSHLTILRAKVASLTMLPTSASHPQARSTWPPFCSFQAVPPRTCYQAMTGSDQKQRDAIEGRVWARGNEDVPGWDNMTYPFKARGTSPFARSSWLARQAASSSARFPPCHPQSFSSTEPKPPRYKKISHVCTKVLAYLPSPWRDGMGRIPDQAHVALGHLVPRPVRQRDRRRPLGASEHLPSATQDAPHLIVCVITRVSKLCVVSIDTWSKPPSARCQDPLKSSLT
jgi:hypothetical protein